MTSTDTRATPPSERPGGSTFRPDLEGLRAVAIGLVLVYHGGVTTLSGGFVGVDVFFVISGFLITGLLIRELERDGRISLARFYARRAKRLLPATGLVLAVTAVMTWLTASVVDFKTFGVDIIAAAFYVVNWQLAGRSVDYLAEDVGASPVQHFWSLAVEEQFYIVWPLLLVLVGWWVARRRGPRLRVAMAVALALVVIPSFAWSIVMTEQNPAAAFFVTTTRLWELGIGAFVAIGATIWTRIPSRIAATLGWLGLLLVLASGFLLDSTVPWPGSAALLPTLGTAAVIVAGFAAGARGPSALLSWWPAVWLGGLSYSLYLWHWPFVICATALWGELDGVKGPAVVLASFVPAYLSHKLVENPIRFSSRVARSNGLALSIGGNFTAVGAIAGLVLVLAVPSTSTAPPPEGERGADGGASLAGSDDAGQATLDALEDVEWFVPDAASAVEDVPEAYADECQVTQESAEPIMCEYGDPDSDTLVVVVGDSKMLQWISAVSDIADEQGWHVMTFTKSACAFTEARLPAEGGEYETCTAWNEEVLERIVDLSPDAVLSSQGSIWGNYESETGTEGAAAGLTARWQRLLDEGIGVITLLDNPNPPFSVYECVAENPDDLRECTFARAEGEEESAASVQEEAADEVDAVQVIDMNDLICPGTECAPVIGNVLVYRQGSHITDTYARSLTDPLRERLVEALETL